MPVKSYDINKPYSSWLRIEYFDPDTGDLLSNTVEEVSPLFQYHCSRITGPNIWDWRNVIKRGDNATTYMQATIASAVLKSGKVEYTTYDYLGRRNARYTESGYVLNSFVYRLPAANADSEAEATAASEVNFAKNYRKVTRSFSGLTFTGELLSGIRALKSPLKAFRKNVFALHKDVSKVQRDLNRKTRDYQQRMAHFASTANGLSGSNAKAIRELERLHTRNRAKASEAIAGTWLEWSFGVKPMIKDLDDYTSALAKITSGSCYDLIRIDGKGKASTLVACETEQYSGVHGGNPCPTEVTIQRFGFSEVTTRGIIRLENAYAEMPPFQQLGVDFLDIVPTAWELVPWSFLADYFINIGDSIDAWSMRFVNWRWLNRTVRNHSKLIAGPRTISPSALVSGNTGTARGGYAAVTRKDVTRENISTTTSFDHRPYLRLPIRENQGYNLAALAALHVKPR